MKVLVAILALGIVGILGAFAIGVYADGRNPVMQERQAENTLYAQHGWRCSRQDAEMVHVNDKNFHGDAMTVRCARFDRDGDGPFTFEQRWHVWSPDGFLPKGADQNWSSE